MPSKFAGWATKDVRSAGFRAVPGAIVRRGAFIAPGAVLMPSFVNIGAHVGEGTMVDTWATVGSCAQIGRNVHISGGTGIGGVLEPLQAGPVIIEDDCFIGARSEVAEGVVVEQGAVMSMGVFIGASTKIVDRATGEVHLRPRAGLFGGRPGHACRARTAARPGLRGDRQARRRADPLQDQHQRAAARLDKPSLSSGPRFCWRGDAGSDNPRNDHARPGTFERKARDAAGADAYACDDPQRHEPRRLGPCSRSP